VDFGPWQGKFARKTGAHKVVRADLSNVDAARGQKIQMSTRPEKGTTLSVYAQPVTEINGGTNPRD
jgi:hypothetical protein